MLITSLLFGYYVKIKYNQEINQMFVQRGVHDEEINCGFYAKTETCTESADIDDLLERMQLNLLDSFDSFEGRGTYYANFVSL